MKELYRKGIAKPRKMNPVRNPVSARHDQGSSKASISKGKRERGGREAVEMGAKLSYGVTERYGAGY